MLHHIWLGTSGLARSRALYDPALAAMGYVRRWQCDDAIGYGPPGGGDKLALKLSSSDVHLAAGPRFHLVSTAAPCRAAVDAFHAAAI